MPIAELTRNAVDVLPRGALEAKLSRRLSEFVLRGVMLDGGHEPAIRYSRQVPGLITRPHLGVESQLVDGWCAAIRDGWIAGCVNPDEDLMAVKGTWGDR